MAKIPERQQIKITGVVSRTIWSKCDCWNFEIFLAAGYCNDPVYISGSMYTRLNKEAVRDAMPVLFELLTDESEPSVRTTLGHFVFVFIHLYMDGNGRLGRFIMNAMLASGGYPWTV